MRMLKVDRHRHILHTLHHEDRLLLSDLEAALGVSRITIQRDLQELEQNGHLKRFHGGAMRTGYTPDSVDHHDRMQINRAEKRRVARQAVTLIAPDSFVALDSSSTTYYMSEELFPPQVRVVTTDIDAFRNLTDQSHVDVVLTGGHLHSRTRTLIGPEAISVVRQFRFDAFFFSVYAIGPDGLYDAHEDDAAIKAEFMERAKQRIVLLDSSKFRPTRGAKVCGIHDIDTLITVGEPPGDIASELRGKTIHTM